MSPVADCSGARRIAGLASHVLVITVLIALTAALTYPLVCNMGARIPGAPAPGDNFEYLYKTWWFKHALFDLAASPFFNSRMFYPFGYNVAMSETTVANTIVALPVTLLFGEVVSYNLTLFASFVLSGLGMYLLVLYLTRSRLAGLFSGIVFAFCPYRMGHMGAGHLPLMGTQWLPLMLLYLDRTRISQRSRDAFMAGLFYALSALSAWYYAYIFGLAALTYLALRTWPWRVTLRQRALWRCGLVFVAVSLILVGPVALSMVDVFREGSRPQSLRYVDQFSASPLDFVYPSTMHPLWGARLINGYAQNVYENTLYLGLVPLILALIALFASRRALVRAWGWLGAVFAVLALGTTLHWRNTPVYVRVPPAVERVFTVGMGFLTGRLALYPISSYSLRVPNAIYFPLPTLLLYLFLPFFRSMRVWTRLGLIAVAAVAVLGGWGLQHVWRRLEGRFSRWRTAVVGGLVALAMLDLVVVPYALGMCDVQPRPVDRWLQQQTGEFAIIEFPVAKALSGRRLYMLRTHDKNISFGYGTFFPREFYDALPVLEQFPSPQAIALLKSWGVRYALLNTRSLGAAWPEMSVALDSTPALRLVHAFEEAPIYQGDRVLRHMPGTEDAFVVERVLVYELI